MTINLAGNDTSSFSNDVNVSGGSRVLIGANAPAASFSALFQDASLAADNFGILGLARNEANVPANGVLGDLRFSDSGHGIAAMIRARRDAGTWTSGSSQPTAIEFYTTPNNASAQALRVLITSAGTLQVASAHLAIGSISSVVRTAPNATGASIFRSVFGNVATTGYIHAIETGTTNYCILSAYKRNEATSPTCTVLANNGLAVQATNNQGTVTLNGATNTDNVRMFSVIHNTQFQ